jgi:hypothetical protein
MIVLLRVFFNGFLFPGIRWSFPTRSLVVFPPRRLVMVILVEELPVRRHKGSVRTIITPDQRGKIARAAHF